MRSMQKLKNVFRLLQALNLIPWYCFVLPCNPLFILHHFATLHHRSSRRTLATPLRRDPKGVTQPWGGTKQNRHASIFHYGNPNAMTLSLLPTVINCTIITIWFLSNMFPDASTWSTCITFTHMSYHTGIHIHIYIYICICVYLNIYIHIYIYTCMYTYKQVYMCLYCLYILYTHTYILHTIYVYLYICIYGSCRTMSYHIIPYHIISHI